MALYPYLDDNKIGIFVLFVSSFVMTSPLLSVPIIFIMCTVSTFVSSSLLLSGSFQTTVLAHQFFKLPRMSRLKAETPGETIFVSLLVNEINNERQGGYKTLNHMIRWHPKYFLRYK